MKKLFPKVVLGTLLLGLTAGAYGACFNGWFLPEPLKQPVSLRDSSVRTGSHGLGYYFLGRSHYGGGYRGGK